MKLGFNLLLWTPHVTAEHEKILKAIKARNADKAIELMDVHLRNVEDALNFSQHNTL